MHFSSLLTALCFGNCASALALSSTPCLQVKTNSGVLNGFVNSSAPNVCQFLGVPFALPPIEARRWLPPSKLKSNTSFAATNIGSACPQLPVKAGAFLNASVYSPNGGDQIEFFPQEIFSEDCLTLNVWTSRSPRRKLPVIVWFFGGAFVQGGTSSLYFNPQSWVERTQEHIVVTVNFRSNIFGFPNAAGLADQNLGLLDQRLALEWVGENIANFGGDPSKIVDWGESAGAIAVDYLDFAYRSDPIVSGRIMNSGFALFEPQGQRQTSDTAHNNFTAISKAFSCVIAVSQVDCMRNVSWQNIERYLAAEAAQKFIFIPVVDERIIFSNYPQRYEVGAFSPVPAIVGTNQHELNALGLQVLGDRSLREAHSRTTYRYRYDGNFSNISPAKFTGAYHGAELPLIFGTAGEYHGESTVYEDIVSRRLQDLWLAFAKDPHHGLRNIGWSPYGEGKAVLIGGANTPVKQIYASQLDSVCATLPTNT